MPRQKFISSYSPSALQMRLLPDSHLIKNIIFTTARLQHVDPNLPFHIILEGTDRLEGLFGDVRTQDHGRNFDIEQLAQKLSVSLQIQGIMERNPHLDHGHRRTSFQGCLGVDHINPRSWDGNVRVGDVDLKKEWDAGQADAIVELEKQLGISEDFSFLQQRDSVNLLQPMGHYVGVRESKDDVRSESEEDDHTDPDQDDDDPSLAEFEDSDDLPIGFDVDDFLPESDSIGLDSTTFSSDRTLTIEGKSTSKPRSSQPYAPMETSRQTKTEKTVLTSMAAEELDDAETKTIVVGQPLDMAFGISEKTQGECWDWTGEFLRPNELVGGLTTRRKLITKFSGRLIFPLSPRVEQVMDRNNIPTITWSLDHAQLLNTLRSAKSEVYPNNQEHELLKNMSAIPLIKNSALPYNGPPKFALSFDIPEVPQAFGPDESVLCPLGCDTEVTIKRLRNHIGQHILGKIRRKSDARLTHKIGDNPCGWCGRENVGCVSRLLSVPGTTKIESTWKIGFMDTSWVSAIFITRSEERVLGIQPEDTDTFRDEYNIPGSDVVMVGQQETQGGRGRAETVTQKNYAQPLAENSKDVEQNDSDDSDMY
ncbi:hypothetical protein PQX77_018344 [Marasmius sp. AFHP31]|nr:hypothetical protein PQX77_018344 [Marasmius sp. AFHP31]